MNKLKVEQSITINLSPEVIFTYMSNLENLAAWSVVVISARKTSSKDMKVGTTVQCTIRLLGKWFDTIYEIIECVPYRYLTIKSISGASPNLIYYRFEPVESGGTVVSLEEYIHFTGGILGVTETVAINMVRRQVTYDLQTLKDLLETTPSLQSSTS